MLESAQLYSLLSFWFIQVEDIHPSHFSTLKFDGMETKSFFEQARSFLLSIPRSSRYFVKSLCDSWHLDVPQQPPSGRIEDLWQRVPAQVRSILTLSPKELDSQVALALGCAVMAERLTKTLSGEEVRQFESSLGEKLYQTLTLFGGLSGGVYGRMPYHALRQVKPAQFLNEARKVGLSYLLAAASLLDRAIAFRFMLKLENRQLYVNQDSRRPIIFPEQDTTHIWAFINRVWKEVGLVCFAS